MDSFTFGLIAFLVIFGGAVFGIFGARRLPDHHLDSQTRAAVSVSVAIVGTVAALVIGLMISTANHSFSQRSDQVSAISTDLVWLDRLFRRYGPEADDARAKLRAWASAKTQELSREPAPRSPPNEHASGSPLQLLEAMQDAIIALAPNDTKRSFLRTQALTLSTNLFEARWLLAQQVDKTIPMPFLILLMFWLGLVFASFGLFAPVNGTAVATLTLCSLAVAGGLTMILELDSPFSGVVRVSIDPLHRAVAEIGR